MGKMGKVDMKGLKEFQKQLEKLQDPDAIIEDCAKELAARLLRLVVKRTPVGDYSGDSYTCASGEQHKGHYVEGKVGGTLRRGWTIGEIKKEGTVYKIDIINPVEYASYVEYGHRTADHKGWVKGHFMMTISENELQNIAPKVLEKKIKKILSSISK
ncbi:MAG: HK97 gp10 family phage protein [Acetatifactor muris]|nr:HK97 gp10 family phage protein [Acetatifactor muris]